MVWEVSSVLKGKGVFRCRLSVLTGPRAVAKRSDGLGFIRRSRIFAKGSGSFRPLRASKKETPRA
jgi:hypothetical protein